MQRIAIFLTAVLVAACVAGCATRHEVQVKPVEVKPIHITIDVNIRVDKALDDFFDEIDAAETKMEKTSN